MLLHAKIDKLIVFNYAVIVIVIPENVSDKIMNFLFILMQHFNEKLFDFFFLKLLVVVLVELDEFEIDGLTDLKGELIGRELEWNVFGFGGRGGCYGYITAVGVLGGLGYLHFIIKGAAGRYFEYRGVYRYEDGKIFWSESIIFATNCLFKS